MQNHTWTETYQILAIGDARVQDGMLWAGYAKDRDGWIDYNSPIWKKPTAWNTLWLRWKGRHSIFRSGRREGVGSWFYGKMSRFYKSYPQNEPLL